VLETYNLQKTRTIFFISATAEEGGQSFAMIGRVTVSPSKSPKSRRNSDRGRGVRPAAGDSSHAGPEPSAPPASRSAAAADATPRQHQHLRTQRRQHRQLERPPQLQRAAIHLASLSHRILPAHNREQKPDSTVSAAAWWTTWTCRTARSASRHPQRSRQPPAQAIPFSSA
jgi:hypothetical protein